MYKRQILDGAQINQPMFGGYKPDAPDAMRIGVIAKRLAARVRAVDTSRPVTGALAGVVMSNETESVSYTHLLYASISYPSKSVRKFITLTRFP